MGPGKALNQYSKGLLVRIHSPQSEGGGRFHCLDRCHKQDFIALEKAITPNMNPLYRGLALFPLVAQAQVLTYNVPELSSPQDPNLVHICHSPLYNTHNKQQQQQQQQQQTTTTTITTKVLDRDTVARIYMGNVSYWNDERIQALNPDLAAKLPARLITIGYVDHDETIASAVEVLKETLESFSVEFERMFLAANRTFSHMPPALRGTALPVPPPTACRVNWIQARTRPPPVQNS
jgi:hypothetical protein